MAASAGEDEEQAGENIDGEADDGDAELADHDPMNPAAWYGEPNICGSCIAWRPEDPRPGETVAAGACKLRPELGRVPATLKKCNIYKPRGQFVYQPGTGSPSSRRRRAGAAKVLRRSADGELVSTRPPPRASLPMAQFERRERDVEYEYEPADPTDLAEPGGSIEPRPPRPVREVPRSIDLGGDESAPAVKQALVEIVRREHGKSSREIHSKYRTGGVAIARTVKGSEVKISAERFFSILDRLRASLDALEKAVEKRPQLGADREEMIANIRRMHGSFTTFNLMFSDRGDYFSGKE